MLIDNIAFLPGTDCHDNNNDYSKIIVCAMFSVANGTIDKRLRIMKERLDMSLQISWPNSDTKNTNI